VITRAHLWLRRHPRIGRPLAVLAVLQLLAATAVCTAPGATAATNASVLNWIGLHDNYGVPIGNLYLSLASIPDQITQAGPDVQAWDPGSWAAWMVHAMKALTVNLAASNILTAEAGCFVGFIAIALWVMKLTVSTYALIVCGEIAKAVTAAVLAVTTRIGLVAIAVPLGVFLAARAIHRGEGGRGWTMMLVAIGMPAAAVTVFFDPAGMMYGPGGLLDFGRRIGFSTAQAVTHNGPIGGGGFTGQVDTLTSSLVTHVGREPLEVFNFGHVVDRVGGCGSAYSQALLTGAPDGPIKALARCGDAAAVQYAQNLDGTNVFPGLILCAAALLFGWFMVSSGASVFMVSVKAIYTTCKLLPALFAGGISGAAQQHAKTTVWRFFKHPLEVVVFIVFVSVMGLTVERIVSSSLPAELGGSSPFAHVLDMGAASMAALYLLHHIRADLEGRHPGRGVLGRATDVALGMGLHAAAGGGGRAALTAGGKMAGWLRNHGKTPWEQLDEQASDAPEKVLGAPQEGFAPVPAQSGGDAPGEVSATTEPDGLAPGPGNAQVPAPAPAAAVSVGRPTNATAEARRAPSRRTRPNRPAAGQPATASAGTQLASPDAELWPSDAAPGEIHPISADPDHRPPADTLAAAVHTYGDPCADDVPLPPEPPAHDDPPPEEPDPNDATNVSPITD
jgi:hypothetical protein